MRAFLLTLAMVLTIAGPAAAQQQRGFDPRAYQSQHVGQPTQILVLGAPHLSAAPDTWDASVLAPLLAKLAAFRPDAIAIEALPGRNIAQVWDYRASYPDVAHDYGGRAASRRRRAFAHTRGNALDLSDAESTRQRAT